MIAGKLFFVGYALVVPMFFHPAWKVVLLYAFTALMGGLVASVVFQLAHCVEETSFPRPPLRGERLPSAWPVHQVETTVECSAS